MAVTVLSADAAVWDRVPVVQDWRPAEAVPGGTAVPVYRPASGPMIEETRFAIEEVLPLPDGSVVVVQDRAATHIAGDDRDIPGWRDAVLLRPDGTSAILHGTPLLDGDHWTVGPDGTIYGFVWSTGQLVAGRPGGRWRTLTAPNGSVLESSGDGGTAAEARLGLVDDIVIGPNRSVYVADSDGIRRMAPDGTIDTVVTRADILRADRPPQEDVDAFTSGLVSIAFDRAGRLWMAHGGFEQGGHTGSFLVRGTDGVLRAVLPLPAHGDAPPQADLVTAPDGTVYGVSASGEASRLTPDGGRPVAMPRDAAGQTLLAVRVGSDGRWWLLGDDPDRGEILLVARLR